MEYGYGKANHCNPSETIDISKTQRSQTVYILWNALVLCGLANVGIAESLFRGNRVVEHVVQTSSFFIDIFMCS